MNKKPWKPQEMELTRRWLAGDPVEDIAKDLGRSVEAVRSHVKDLRLKGRPRRPGGSVKGAPQGVAGLPPDHDDRAQRLCLKCKQLFLSEHRGIRICPKCKPAVNAAAGGLGVARTAEAL